MAKWHIRERMSSLALLRQKMVRIEVVRIGPVFGRSLHMEHAENYLSAGRHVVAADVEIRNGGAFDVRSGWKQSQSLLEAAIK